MGYKTRQMPATLVVRHGNSKRRPSAARSLCTRAVGPDVYAPAVQDVEVRWREKVVEPEVKNVWLLGLE